MFSNASSIAVSATPRGALAELSGEFIVKLRNRSLRSLGAASACPFERGVGKRGKRRQRGFYIVGLYARIIYACYSCRGLPYSAGVDGVRI